MLAGKLAIVTGAGGGIGRVTCQTLAKEGAQIVVTDLNKSSSEETLKSLAGSGHTSFVMDVTNTESVESVFQAVKAKYNAPPTIVVNCAGILLFHAFLDETPDVFQRQMDINVKGTYNVTKTACREMKDAALPGSIINIASIAADGLPMIVSYATSKAAVIAMSRSVGKEMAQYGIRCNAISPGPTDTSLLDPLSEDYGKSLMQNVAMGRMGKPQEIANLITFLASEKSSYITGAAVRIDGGY